MKRIATLLAVLCLVSPAFAAGELTDGRKVLEKSAEAIKKIKTVQYRADYIGTAWAQQYVPMVKGMVVVGKQSKWDIPRFRCEVKIQKYGSEEVQDVTAGCNGDVYFLIDPKTKKAHEDMDQAVLGSNSRDIQRPVMGAFSEPEPYHEILEPDGDAPEIGLKGTANVADEDCYEVQIKPKSPPELRLFIAKKDFLPRKIIRTYDNPQGGDEKGTTELTVLDLKVNPKLDGDPFKLVTPPGFTKTDEFAP